MPSRRLRERAQPAGMGSVTPAHPLMRSIHKKRFGRKEPEQRAFGRALCGRALCGTQIVDSVDVSIKSVCQSVIWGHDYRLGFIILSLLFKAIKKAKLFSMITSLVLYVSSCSLHLVESLSLINTTYSFLNVFFIIQQKNTIGLFFHSISPRIIQ